VPGGRRHDQRGIALSTPLALLSAAAVVLAGAAFVGTNGAHRDKAASVSAAATPTATVSASGPSTRPPSRPARAKQQPKKHVKHVVRRSGTYVEVFNNSGIHGLAGSVAGRAQGAGWQVVGSDNWYGTIPASTVYYPARLHAQASLLGKDLGISRVRPSIAPMRGDRLTVILTSDYS